MASHGSMADMALGTESLVALVRRNMLKRTGLFVFVLMLVAACTGGSHKGERVPTSATSPSSTTSSTNRPTTTLPPPPPPGTIVIADCARGYHNPPGRGDICVRNA
jgi:hypothetical protein